MTLQQAIENYRYRAKTAVTEPTREENTQVAEWLERLARLEGDR